MNTLRLECIYAGMKQFAERKFPSVHFSQRGLGGQWGRYGKTWETNHQNPQKERIYRARLVVDKCTSTRRFWADNPTQDPLSLMECSFIPVQSCLFRHPVGSIRKIPKVHKIRDNRRYFIEAVGRLSGGIGMEEKIYGECEQISQYNVPMRSRLWHRFWMVNKVSRFSQVLCRWFTYKGDFSNQVGVWRGRNSRKKSRKNLQKWTFAKTQGCLAFQDIHRV
ncbi:hypothetical protein DL93DRAFT_1591163 [Clavulina sp. PMI_390]|nr:hypothetical protein DL93DRAFT_1591163 [Clavulina sp. PMI_390]